MVDALKQLDDAFEGHVLEWKQGHWGTDEPFNVEYAEDFSNYYYRVGDRIFVQPKDQDCMPVCYDCGEPAHVLETFRPPCAGRYPGTETPGKTIRQFYCPVCQDPEPQGTLRKIVTPS